MESNPAERIAGAADTNPTIHPAVAMALAGHTNLDGEALGHVSKFMDMYGAVKDHIEEASKSDPRTSHSSGFWGDVMHAAHSVWSKATIPGTDFNAGTFLTNAAGGVDDLFHAAENGANRFSNTLVQGATGGRFRLDTNSGFMPRLVGVKDTGSGWAAAGRSINFLAGLASGKINDPQQTNAEANAKEAIANLKKAQAEVEQYPTEKTIGEYNAALALAKHYYSQVSNPALLNYGTAVQSVANASPQNLLFSPTNNVFFQMAHAAAYTISYAEKHGWDAALGRLAPSVALAVLTDGALSAEIEVGSATSDELILANAARVEAAGGTLTDEESILVAEAEMRNVSRDLFSNKAQEMDAQAATAREQAIENVTSDIKRGIYRTFDKVAENVAPVAQAVKGVMVPASSIRMNVMYQAIGAGAMADPQSAALWEKTKNLQVYRGGQAQGQDATALLKEMDLDKSAMYYSPLSATAGLADFYTKWLGADPFGAVGEVLARARTAEGLSGTLGRWLGGLKIESVEDAFRTARQYPTVLKSYETAAHLKTAGEIMEAFPGTYTAKQASELARLNSVDKVIEWHGIQGEAGQLMRRVAPRLTAFDGLKTALRGSLGDKLRLNGVTTAEGVRFMLSILSADQLRQYGFDIDETLNMAATTDPDARARQIFGRWLGSRLSKATMYFDEQAGAMTRSVFNPLTDNSVEGAMRWANRALFTREEIKAIGQALVDADTEGRVEVFRKMNLYAASRFSDAGLAHGSVEQLQNLMDRFIAETVDARMGTWSPGTRGVTVGGRDSEGLGATYDPTNPNAAPKQSAILERQKGTLKFIDHRVLRGLGIATKNIADDIPPRLLDRISNIRLDLSNVARAADELGPLGVDVSRSVNRWMKDELSRPNLNTLSLSGTLNASYKDALKEIQDEVGKLARGRTKDTSKQVQRFVEVFGRLQQETIDLRALRDAIIDHNVMRKSYRFGSPEYMAESERIISEIPKKFGVQGMGPFEVMKSFLFDFQHIQGRVAAFEMATGFLRDELSQDFTWFEDFEKNHTEYQLLRSNGEKANAELAKEWGARVAENKAVKNGFLNVWFRTIDRLNTLQNRLFVPLALYSGAWAYHVAISEGTLNTLRNGFGTTYDAKLVTAIAKHANNTGYLGGIYTKIIDKWDTKISEKLEAIDEGDIIAHTTSRSLDGALGLIRLARGIHDVASGLLMGFDRLLLAGMDQAQLDRMIGDFVDATVSEDGQIDKMGVHHVSDVYDDKSLDKHGKQLVYGLDENGNKAIDKVFRNRTWARSNSTDMGYVTALHEALHMVNGDEIGGPIAKYFHDRVYAAGVEGLDKHEIEEMGTREILRRGVEEFSAPEDWDALIKDMKKFSLDHIRSFSDNYLKAYARNSEILAMDYTERDPVTGAPLMSPHHDWAKALTHHITDLTGKADPRTGERIIHPSLLEQLVKPEVDPDHELVDLFTKHDEELGGPEIPQNTEPENIPNYTMSKRRLEATGIEKINFIGRLTEWGHSRIFGPIANSLVRDPLYLLEYHLEMEGLRSLDKFGGKPFYSEEEMQVMAASRAAQKMIRFVHNPLDKMVIEENMRLAAPFYFAQNQAIRRAMRLFDENPGAFEKYLKLSLGVTNWVSANTKNGQEPIFYIPGSQVFGWLAAHNPVNGLLGDAIAGVDSLGFAIGGTPGTVSPMFPTGAQFSASGIAGNLARPSWGAIAIVGGEIAKSLQELHWSISRDVSHLLTTVLGPSSQYSLSTELDPSSVTRAAYASVMAKVNPEWDSTSASTVLNVMTNEADDLYTRFFEEASQEYMTKNNLTAKQWRAEVLNNPKNVRFLSGVAASKFTAWLNNPQNAAKFIDGAKNQASTLLFFKAAAAMGSPISPELMQIYNGNSKFNAILAKDGVNSFNEALAQYTSEEPNHFIDAVISKYQDPYGVWQGTQDTVNLINNHPDLVKKYNWSMAYVQPSNGKYDANASSVLRGAQLKQMDTPEEFISALEIKAGQEYYDYVIKPETPMNGLKQAAINWGLLNNPTWLAYHTGVAYASAATETLNQMATMVNDKSVPNSVFYGGESGREVYRQLVNIAQTGLQHYSDLKTTSTRNEFSYNWYNQMSTLAKNNPVFSDFITHVMAPILERSNM